MSLSEEIYADLQEQLPALQEALKNGVAWGSELANRYIMYDLAIHALEMLLAIGIISFFIWFGFYFAKKADDWSYAAEETARGFLVLGGLFLGGGSVIVILVNTSIILKDIFIPEIRIIELLSRLIT